MVVPLYTDDVHAYQSTLAAKRPCERESEMPSPGDSSPWSTSSRTSPGSVEGAACPLATTRSRDAYAGSRGVEYLPSRRGRRIRIRRSSSGSSSSILPGGHGSPATQLVEGARIVSQTQVQHRQSIYRLDSFTLPIFCVSVRCVLNNLYLGCLATDLLQGDRECAAWRHGVVWKTLVIF